MRVRRTKARGAADGATPSGERAADPAPLRGLIARTVARQKVRFLIVGGINTVVGYSLFALFYQVWWSGLRFGYLLSLVLSYAISITMAFFLYRRFVFLASGHVVRDFVAFVGVNLVAIVTNVVLLTLLVEAADLPPFLAQAIALVGTTVISYFGHREISFRRRAHD